MRVNTVIAAGIILAFGSVFVGTVFGEEAFDPSRKAYQGALSNTEIPSAEVSPPVKPVVKKVKKDVVARHSLDEIIFKISRAKANLEEQQDEDFNKAIEFLLLALVELKRIRD